MRLLRVALFSLAVSSLPLASTLVTSDARASVSIAVAFDALVKDADAVAVMTPQEAKSVWEDGRIYTYTRVKVDQSVAGDVGTGAEGWVRTMGGVVGKIGQLVDGEPVFAPGKPSLLFVRKFKTGGVFEVSARAQGQYPITVDDATKLRRTTRSANVGVLFPPKPKAAAATEASQLQSQSAAATEAANAKIRLAGEVLHDRPLDDAAREIASTWKRLHPAPPAK